MPIEKRKNWSKSIEEYTKNHEINKWYTRKKSDNLSDDGLSNQNWSDNKLTWWVIAIWIVLLMFIIFTFSKLNTLGTSDDSTVQALEKKVKNLESEISALKKDKWSVVEATYEWWSSTTNNVKRIWERSFWFPAEAEWKYCYILWSKLDGADGWTVRWYLGARYNWSTYQTADSYEAQVNNWAQKIEISKDGKNLSTSERNNLYFSITLLCQEKNTIKLFQ